MAGREILRVYCIRNSGYDLRMLQKQIELAVRHARDSDSLRAASPPIAILANESTLHYRFGITQEKVLEAVARMQKSLPQGVWIAVAFNIFQKSAPRREAEHANMGYIFTRDGLDFKPQRTYTNMDSDLLDRYTLTPAKHEIAWLNRGAQMQNAREPYPALLMPDGHSIEYRICADVDKRPLAEDKKAITLVSADQLSNMAAISSLADLRKGLIVNDLASKGLIVETIGKSTVCRLDRSMSLASIRESS
ncbi:Uncharacterised protein [uncultured archaeon]|nr:Uncharacterised protein [uncultured archaeon]